ncbi:hypothetical protein L484_003262 [Morus notabilis]|uniref:Uncharacterized protein n=1 Tax=Morus notabilis TaxID=981085 RepID=W9QTH8_9ROSA|nr:hypothetical protein L484_003262 [Morus notabilis]
MGTTNGECLRFQHLHRRLYGVVSEVSDSRCWCLMELTRKHGFIMLNDIFHFVDITPETMEAQFINELKSDIRAEIKKLRPIGLIRVMEMAQRIEDCNVAIHHTKNGLGGAYSCGPFVHSSPVTRTVNSIISRSGNGVVSGASSNLGVVVPSGTEKGKGQ